MSEEDKPKPRSQPVRPPRRRANAPDGEPISHLPEYLRRAAKKYLILPGGAASGGAGPKDTPMPSLTKTEMARLDDQIKARLRDLFKERFSGKETLQVRTTIYDAVMLATNPKRIGELRQGTAPPTADEANKLATYFKDAELTTLVSSRHPPSERSR